MAVALAVLGAAAQLVLRSANDAEQRASDAAVTGVTDAQLDSLLRAAARAAPLSAPPIAAPPAPPAAPVGAGTRAGGAGSPAGRATAATPPAPVAPARATPPAGQPRPTRRDAVPAVAAGSRPPAAPAVTGTATPAAVPVVDRVPPADARCASPRSGDQRACLLAAVDRGDASLTREYQALIAELRRQAGGVREPPAVEALRVEQRAWINARDRRCRAALAGREGALWGVARAPCFAALSDRRAGELRARLARLVRADSAPANGAG